MSGRPTSCNDHQSGGTAIIASSTATAVNARRRLRKNQRNGAARYRSVGKLRLTLEVVAISITPFDRPPTRLATVRSSVMPPGAGVNDNRKRVVRRDRGIEVGPCLTRAVAVLWDRIPLR